MEPPGRLKHLEVNNLKTCQEYLEEVNKLKKIVCLFKCRRKDSLWGGNSCFFLRCWSGAQIRNERSNQHSRTHLWRLEVTAKSHSNCTLSAQITNKSSVYSFAPCAEFLESLFVCVCQKSCFRQQLISLNFSSRCLDTKSLQKNPKKRFLTRCLRNRDTNKDWACRISYNTAVLDLLPPGYLHAHVTSRDQMCNEVR